MEKFGMLKLQLESVKNRTKWQEVDNLGWIYTNTPDDVKTQAIRLLHESLNSFGATEFYIDYGNDVATHFLYMAFISHFSDIMGHAVYNAIETNKDWIFNEYYDMEPKHIKDAMRSDIDIFKKSYNIDERYIVALFRMNKYVDYLVSEHGIWQYVPATVRESVESGVSLNDNDTFDSIIAKIIYNNMSSFEVLGNIILFTQKIISNKNQQAIQTSDLYQYFTKWSAIR